ncbi:MAG: ATPase [Marinobacter sp.]|uniref:ATPase n=1 Tax=Marinobacter sp. TaxID=50741 RepID=UPI00299F2FE3|nr:ATPase [Marinobacter sp.]MDX1755405.1 ATPase [Marinobacter sp.]
MQIRTFGELIEWTRDLHHQLSERLADSSQQHQQERTRALLQYLADHEAMLDRAIAEFERQGDQKAMQTRFYDYLNHNPVETRRLSDLPYANMSFDEICRELFDVHDQIMALYNTLIGKAEIPEVISMLEDLLALEEHEAMRLALQIGRMSDV